MPEKPPIVLTIAGFDPSSGAGVTADIKTIAAHACYGVACITAMTVQSTAGVKRVEMVDPALVSETLEELAADLDIAAVHIGMLGSGKVVKAVADFLSARLGGQGGNRSAGQPGKARLPHIVLDPILKSSSSTELLDAAGVKLLVERLIPLADVVTPNIDEAAVIAGIQVRDLDEMKVASAKLHEMGASAVVITGGHLEKAIDLLSFKTRGGIEQEIFRAERQRSHSTHGTGCAFSSHGLSPGPRPGFGGSCPAGEDLCHRRNLLRAAVGARSRADSPPLSNESAEARCRDGKRNISGVSRGRDSKISSGVFPLQRRQLPLTAIPRGKIEWPASPQSSLP